MCAFGFNRAKSEEDTPFILGDTFLRAAYVFYDLDRKLVGLGSALFDVTETDYVEANNKGDIPSVSTVTNAPPMQTSSKFRVPAAESFWSGVVSKLAIPTVTPKSLSNGVSVTSTITAVKGKDKHGVKTTSTLSSTSTSETSKKSAAAPVPALEISAVSVVIVALCASMMLMGAFIV